MQVLVHPIGGCLFMWTLIIQLVLQGSGVYADDATKNCKLTFESESERKVLQRIEPLGHKNFTAETKIGEDTYSYVFRLCGDAGGVPGAGVIQVEGQKTEKKVTVIGMYNATEVIGGSDYVWLLYGNGEKYDTHCSQEQRKAILMIFCNRDVNMGQLEVVQENREREQNCFYQFKIESSVVCPPLEYKLSTGSILLIIAFCLLTVYLIGGFLYQRLIMGAKGMEQFPNYAFWTEVGNLSAVSPNVDEANWLQFISVELGLGDSLLKVRGQFQPSQAARFASIYQSCFQNMSAVPPEGQICSQSINGGNPALYILFIGIVYSSPVYTYILAK